PQLTVVQYDVALRPGTAAASYANTLAAALGPDYSVSANNATPSEFAAVIGLIATLTLLLAAVAGLGVLNTVVLQTRERVHDLGVFKAVGMTPRPGRWPQRSGRPAPAPPPPCAPSRPAWAFTSSPPISSRTAHAGDGGGAGRQPFGPYRLPAPFAHPVPALVQPPQRGLGRRHL